MNKLVYDRGIDKWVCSKCGASYFPHEVSRCFDYVSQEIDIATIKFLGIDEYDFVPCHCMDCGCLWKKFKI